MLGLLNELWQINFVLNNSDLTYHLKFNIIATKINDLF